MLRTGSCASFRRSIRRFSDSGYLYENSEGYDRGDKFKYYRTLPSLREYLLIAQDRPAVTLYRRGAGSDLFRIIDVEGLNATLELTSIGVALSLAELYESVDIS